MPRVLSDNLFVDDVLYRVGEIPPPEVAARIGAHAWTQTPDVEAPSAAGVVSGEDAPVQGSLPPAAAPEAAGGGEPAHPEEPPRAGRGASKAAWLDYAASLGIDARALESRDDIIAAVDKAQGNAESAHRVAVGMNEHDDVVDVIDGDHGKAGEGQ